MDSIRRLTSKLRRRMTDLPAYPAHFDFGRLFADIGRLLGRAWLPLALCVILLGVAPAVIAALPWWGSQADDPTFRRIWAEITLAKWTIILLSQCAVVVTITGVSLHVLTGAAWREVFGWRALAGGYLTALCLSLLVNWPSALAPLSVFYPWIATAGWLLWLAVLVCQLLMFASAGIAVSVAVADRVLVGSAIAGSFRLLRGLRWRMVALGFAYLFALVLSGYAMAVVLSLFRVGVYGPGVGRALVSVSQLLISVPAQIGCVSVFLQARRIADGPGEKELHEVFS
jgi:hypothetical protein